MLLGGTGSVWSRVAEVAREHGWHPPKSLDSDENFKPEHTLFCRELRFVAIYALFFWRSLGKKSAFLGKNSASWARSAQVHGIYSHLGVIFNKVMMKKYFFFCSRTLWSLVFGPVESSSSWCQVVGFTPFFEPWSSFPA